MCRQKAIELLHQFQLKMTGPRLAVLELLVREHGPYSIEDMHRILRKKFDVVTLYRCVTLFEKLGVVKRIEFGDGTARYEFFKEEYHHHHIVCTSCHKHEDIEDCGADRLEKVVRKKGYSEVSHSLELFGLCPSCQKKDRPLET